MNKSETKLLESLNLPEDLKRLSRQELDSLARELREKLLTIGDTCGGHLASNLGVVELSIALHSVLNSPIDKILWDTSHQSYVHKMLTGRLDKIMTIRQDNGLSGFTRISESEHDAFGAGHASTALSAAVGIATARDIQKKDYSVCAVIGDASLSGGMSFEALNNAQLLKNNFICVLNDNNMAISKPVGAMANYITGVRTSVPYNKAKRKFERIFEKIPKIGEPLKRRIERTVDLLRDVVLDTKVGVMFEEFGFKYIGPVDGHNITMIMAALKYAKSYQGPIMVHIITKKGKGYAVAEDNPTDYHGVSPKVKNKLINKNKTFTNIFGETIVKIAKKDSLVSVVTPAMKAGSGLNEYAENFPDRFFDVGIAEEHAVTFSAGLARAGLKPVLAIYATFLQRGYDQIVHDVCLQNLPVIFAIDRAGIVGADGPTHHGVFDYAYLLHIPNLCILAPKDGDELRSMFEWAVNQNKAIAIRYPRGRTPDQTGLVKTEEFNNKAEVLFENLDNKNIKKVDKLDVLLIAAGTMAWPAYEAAKKLKGDNVCSAVINLRAIKPLDVSLLKEYVQKADNIFVVEEGCAIGGIYSYIIRQFCDSDKPVKNWHQIAIPDEFVTHGKTENLKAKYFLDEAGIYEKVTAVSS